MSLGPVTSQQSVTRTARTDDGATSQSTATETGSQASAQPAKESVPEEVVNAARSAFKGIEDAFKNGLLGGPSPDQKGLPDGEELAGGKPIKRCGRGGRCTASSSPVRGLGTLA